MAYDINKVINIASEEVGYLEKKSNSSLDNKTNNAGSNNYTKYWRDIYPSYQGQAWCLCFVIWCFVKAYGTANAKKLLCMENGYTFYTPTSANYFRNKKQWHTSPKVGDQIFFKNSSRICHTGIVYKVTSSTVYTIEGNTSGASGVVANGGGVCKKSYALNNSRIAGYGRPNYGVVASSSNNTTSSKGFLSKGDTGVEVVELQQKLISLGYNCGASGADGDFGDNTYNALLQFQKDNGLVVDGCYGTASKAKLIELYNLNSKKTYSGEYPSLPPRGYYMVGDGYQTIINYASQIKNLQKYLNWAINSGLTVDGGYGNKTCEAVIRFQKTYGLEQDGLWGKNCLAKAKTIQK